MFFINKKAQIANTLTWFTATIIIFFIMVLFLTVSVLDSGRKKVTTGWDDINLEKFNGNLKSQRVLFNLLETNFVLDNQTLKLKDWLKLDLFRMEESKKAVLREEVRLKILNIIKESGGKDCYVFQAVSGLNNDSEDLLKNVDPRGAGYVSDFISKSSIEFGTYFNPAMDLRGVRYAGDAHKKLLKRATSIFLIRDTNINVFGVQEDYQKVKIKFYLGAC